MTTMAEREYDALHNEGADGYNPIRAEREARERAAAAAAPATDDEMRRRAARAEAAAKELHGYGSPEHLAAQAEWLRIGREIDVRAEAREAAAAAAFAAEWSRELTTARRAEWNKAITGGGANTNGRPDMRKLRALEVRLGYEFDALKRAIRLHGL